MGFESLYADGIEADIQRKAANPGAVPPMPFSVWSMLSAGAKGIPAGGLEVGASLAEQLKVAQSETLRAGRPKVLQDQPDISGRQSQDLGYTLDAATGLRSAANGFAPPESAHVADQALFGLTRIGTKAVGATIAAGGNPLAAGVMLGAEETNTSYTALIAKGIDSATALKVAGVQGASAGLSIALPMVGSTAAKTIGLGFAGGPGTYMAQEALSKQILEKAGYHDEASLHNPTDPLGLTLSTVLPAVFGGVHIAGLKPKPAPSIVDVVQSLESGGKRYGKDGQLLTSPKGAQGEMQVVPGTATDPGFGVAPARDNSPDELARVGRDYIAAMQTRYGSNDLALAAYNAGPGTVDKAIKAHGADWLAHMPDETKAYVAKGMKRLGDDTVAHAAADPATVDAARTRVTQDALNRSMPEHPMAHAEVMRAADDIGAGRAHDSELTSIYGDMEPKFEVPGEVQASMRTVDGMPEIRNGSIRLDGAHPIERFEAILDPGEQMVRFAVRSPEGQVLGHTDLLLKDGQISGLYDVEVRTDARRQGIGGKVAEAITSLQPDRKLDISNIVPEARSFWESVGVHVNEGSPSSTLDWHQFAQSSAARERGIPQRGASLERRAPAADARADSGDGRPALGEARELSPEDAARFFDAANHLPDHTRVAEPARKVDPPKADTQRIARIAEESPDLKVTLPGRDGSMTVAEALETAKAEAQEEMKQAGLVRTALECALSFGA